MKEYGIFVKGWPFKGICSWPMTSETSKRTAEMRYREFLKYSPEDCEIIMKMREVSPWRKMRMEGGCSK